MLVYTHRVPLRAVVRWLWSPVCNNISICIRYGELNDNYTTSEYNYRKLTKL